MVLDFQALMDPAKRREAEREREQQAKEQADRDARTRAALAAVGRAEEAGRLNDNEARFVRQATGKWYRNGGFLTDAQIGWVMDLAVRDSFVLQSPAGTYIEPESTGYVVRSVRRGGGEMVVVPDVEALIELGKEECWSDRDIAAIQKRWGRPQTQAGAARFSFGPPKQTARPLPSKGAAEPGLARGDERAAVSFTPFFQGSSAFSNWHKVAFIVGGTTFNCVEQYMMYAKAKFFGDEGTAAAVLATQDPGRQKALGRRVAGFDDSIWIENRMSIVRTGVLAKFTQNSRLQEALFATAGTELVEASPYDRVWGVGLAATDPRIHDRSQWRGENLLGKILTEVRDHLMDEARMTQRNPSDRERGSTDHDLAQTPHAARFRFGPAVEPAHAAEPVRQDYQRQRAGA